jgi:hypothetical protein
MSAHPIPIGIPAHRAQSLDGRLAGKAPQVQSNAPKGLNFALVGKFIRFNRNSNNLDKTIIF